MWKCASRRLRDTIERANHFDKRSAAGVFNDSDTSDNPTSKPRSSCWFTSRKNWNTIHVDNGGTINVTNKFKDNNAALSNQFSKRKRSLRNNTNANFDNASVNTESFNHPCHWFSSWKFIKCSQSNNNTNGKKWNFDHLNNGWISALTWSGALVMGWYASQIIHLKNKYHSRKQKICPSINHVLTSVHLYVDYVNSNLVCRNKHLNAGIDSTESLANMSPALHSYVSYVTKDVVHENTTSNIEKIIENFLPSVHLMTNEHNAQSTQSSHSSNDVASSNSFIDNDLGNVLNSIENKLGLAAIENGEVKDGINLLRSAAHRYHAPALYNLGLCYEMGIGVEVDEKKAMEYYSSASALEHAGAMYNLGIYYGKGLGGLSQDTTMAMRLFRLAAVQGQKEAIEALKSLNSEAPEIGLNDKESLWTSSYVKSKHIVPAQSTLFVSNVNYMPHSEATVF